MQEVSMFEAKTQLSKLVKLANQGEEGVITSGRARKPVARITAIEPKQAERRPLGLYRGKLADEREPPTRQQLGRGHITSLASSDRCALRRELMCCYRALEIRSGSAYAISRRANKVTTAAVPRKEKPPKR